MKHVKIEALSIDHINGGGDKERKVITNQSHGGGGLYMTLGISNQYIAGIIDGEGTIRLTTRKSSTHKSGIRFCPSIFLQMVESDGTNEIFNYLHHKYDVPIKYRVPKNTKHRKSLLTYFLGNKLKIFLNDILPYLIVKKKQGDLVLKYFDLVQNIKPYKSNPLPKDNFIMRLEIFNELSVLNLRGNKKANKINIEKMVSEIYETC